jgi:hypothetical protein
LTGTIAACAYDHERRVASINRGTGPLFAAAHEFAYLHIALPPARRSAFFQDSVNHCKVMHDLSAVTMPASGTAAVSIPPTHGARRETIDARACDHCPCRGVRAGARRRRDVDVQRLPGRQGREGLWLSPGPEMARPRAARLGPARRGLLGRLRLAAGPRANQPPLRPRLCRAALDRRQRHGRQRLLCARGDGRDQVPDDRG